MATMNMHMPTMAAMSPFHATGLRQLPASPDQPDVVDQLRQRVEMKFGSLRAAFCRLDRDNSGYLSRDEILAALHDFNISPRHLNNLVGSIDTNRDGLISFAEFSAALRPRADAFAARHTPDRFVTNRHVVAPNVAGGQVFMNDNLSLARSGEVRPDAGLVPLPLHGAGGDASAADLAMYSTTVSNLLYTKYRDFAAAFRAIDQDKDGRLSEAELKRAIRLYNLPIPERHVEQMFAQMAIRGTVDYEMFATALKRKDALGN